MENLNINQLEKIYELKETSSKIKKMIDVFLIAINDWPDPILKLEDYESEVSKFIGGRTTKDKIEIAISQIDFSKNSWQAESLTKILDVFEFYKNGMSLKEIIFDLNMKFFADESPPG